MPLPQKPPGRGAENRRVHFPFICTPRGGSFEAWIAGPCHWYDCHCIGRSKPCLHEMTGGELQCDRDHNLDEPRCIGYQPLYLCSNGRPGFVIVYDYAREQIDLLRHRHKVTVARGKGKSDTVGIEYQQINAPMYTSSRADLMRPADLTESLLRIWKIPELVGWYRLTHGASDNAVSPGPKPFGDSKPAASEKDVRTMVARTVIAQAGGEQPEKLAADDVNRLMQSMMGKGQKRDAEKNGNGKK